MKSIVLDWFGYLTIYQYIFSYYKFIQILHYNTWYKFLYLLEFLSTLFFLWYWLYYRSIAVASPACDQTHQRSIWSPSCRGPNQIEVIAPMDLEDGEMRRIRAWRRRKAHHGHHALPMCGARRACVPPITGIIWAVNLSLPSFCLISKSIYEPVNLTSKQRLMRLRTSQGLSMGFLLRRLLLRWCE